MKQIITIKGMSCNHCVMHVKEALLELTEIMEVEVDLNKNIAVIETKEKVKKEILVETIEAIGYQVVEVK
jgi:copper chaperone